MQIGWVESATAFLTTVDALYLSDYNAGTISTLTFDLKLDSDSVAGDCVTITFTNPYAAFDPAYGPFNHGLTPFSCGVKISLNYFRVLQHKHAKGLVILASKFYLKCRVISTLGLASTFRTPILQLTLEIS